MSAHTPGPWVVTSTYDGSRTIAILRGLTPIGSHVNSSVDYMGDSTGTQLNADAHLIAAAPELLQALQVILEEPHGCPFCDSGRLRTPDVPGKEHTENCGFYLARRAIAKAEGR